MKKLILAWLLITSSHGLYAQNEKNNIHASIVGFFNGLTLVNVDTMNYYSTPDFHFLEDGQIWNLDTLINKLLPRKNSNVQRINKFEFIKTEQTGNVAWVSYHNSAAFRLGEKQHVVKWLESAVLVKSKDKWRIQLLHSTKLK